MQKMELKRLNTSSWGRYKELAGD